MNQPDSPLTALIAQLPHYYQVQSWVGGGVRMLTDPENPERGEWIKVADVEALAARLPPARGVAINGAQHIDQRSRAPRPSTAPANSRSR